MRDNGLALKGSNLFDEAGEKLFITLGRGEFNISGIQNRTLRKLLPEFNTGQISRTLRRLRTHRMIRKARNSYRYYLTAMGKRVIALGLKIKNLFIISELAPAT